MVVTVCFSRVEVLSLMRIPDEFVGDPTISYHPLEKSSGKGGGLWARDANMAEFREQNGLEVPKLSNKEKTDTSLCVWIKSHEIMKHTFWDGKILFFLLIL